jgi:phosphoglycolate phosphatase
MGRDFHIAVASTTGSAFIEKKIAEEGMDGIIEFVSGGDDGSSDKKNKIGRVLEHFAVPSRAAIMVGDTVMDIECARALEIPSIAVTYGWNSRRRLEAAEPDLIVDTPADVVPAIRRLVKMNGNDG